MSKTRLFPAAIAAALSLTGCFSRFESAGLHGAGSMRVEVEVYKGPLGQSPDLQVGELDGVLAETVRALAYWSEATIHDQGLMQYCMNEETLQSIPGCWPLKLAVESAEEIILGICDIKDFWVDDFELKRPGYPTDAELKNETGKPEPRSNELRRIIDDLRKENERLKFSNNNEKIKENERALADRVLELRVKNYELMKAAEEIWSPPFHRVRDACARRSLPTGTTTKTELPSDSGRPVPLPSPSSQAMLGGTRLGSSPTMDEILTRKHEFVRRIAAVAAMMKSKSFRIADENLHRVPENASARIKLANFTLTMSEFANQIQARISALDKQIDPGGSESRLMPMGDYLRDASLTDFVHLFDWFEATEEAIGDKNGFKPKLDPKERIRAAERLFSDYYWEKVNEVHASGQGDVSMAFIKDELGNWDLKSFSNDPARLLEGYRSAANAALTGIVKLAAKPLGADGLVQAHGLLGLANQVASGQAAATMPPGMDVGALHERTRQRILTKRAQFAETKETLDSELTKATQAVTTAQAEYERERTAANADAQKLAAAEERLRTAKVQKEVVEKLRASLPRQAVDAIRDVMDDHLAVVAALQEAHATPAQAVNPTLPESTR